MKFIHSLNLSPEQTIQETEGAMLLKFIRLLKLSQGQKILDVGCGYGRSLKLLRSKGFEVVGVEINQDIVDANNQAGLACMSDSQFKQTDDLYDVLLLMHVIEHFTPDALVGFMDHYLDRLRPGGHLIIATPLLTASFFDDFDHLKPYHPTGIQMVFGRGKAQVQYYARNTLELVDVWFRRGPFVLRFFSGIYVGKHNSRLLLMINKLSTLLFRMSFGMLGKPNGWMGLYRKVL